MTFVFYAGDCQSLKFIIVSSLFQWSFGVTCWEVFSLGRNPYPGVDPFTLIKHLEGGKRLDKPQNAACTENVYGIIIAKTCMLYMHNLMTMHAVLIMCTYIVAMQRGKYCMLSCYSCDNIILDTMHKTLHRGQFGMYCLATCSSCTSSYIMLFVYNM